MPARRIRAGQTVQVQAEAATVTIRALGVDGGELLAVHARATTRGAWVIDPAHWDGLADGHTRATIVEGPAASRTEPPGDEPGLLAALLQAHPAAGAQVATRPLADYQTAATNKSITIIGSETA